MSEQLIDVKEVCRRVSISRTHLWQMERNGEFPRATRIGRILRWRAAEVDKWILERTGAAPQPDAETRAAPSA